MKKALWRSIFVAGTFVSVLGCTAPVLVQPPPTEVQEASVVAVTAFAPSEAVTLDAPVRGVGEGVATGVGQGALLSVMGGASTSDPIGLALGVILAPAFGVAGGVYGGLHAHPGEEVDAAVAVLTRTLAEVQAHEALSHSVVDAGKRRSVPELVAIAEAPDSSGNELDFRLVLELHPKQHQLVVIGRIDPDARLVLGAKAYVWRTTDEAELYWREWEYASESLKYFKWAEGGGERLRLEISTGYRLLGEKIVSDLFVSREVEEVRQPPLPSEEVWTVSGPDAAKP